MRMQRGNAKSKCRGIAGMVRHAFVSGYNHVTISHLYSILRSQPATPPSLSVGRLTLATNLFPPCTQNHTLNSPPDLPSFDPSRAAVIEGLAADPLWVYQRSRLFVPRPTLIVLPHLSSPPSRRHAFRRPRLGLGRPCLPRPVLHLRHVRGGIR
jgi:hypothetical protein